jgi:hypothetical protein
MIANSFLQKEMRVAPKGALTCIAPLARMNRYLVHVEGRASTPVPDGVPVSLCVRRVVIAQFDRIRAESGWDKARPDSYR